MPAMYNNESSYEFHESHKKQSSSVGQPSNQHVVNENESKSRFNNLCPRRKQKTTAWSSSSSSSSLTTGSLFSLSDYSSASRKYKTTGILFNNLDLVPFDPKIDPEPYACYNCWHLDHKYCDCPDNKIFKYCHNCGRRGVAMKDCPRCARAYINYLDWNYKHPNICVNSMKVEEPVDDIQLNIVDEKYDKNWDDFVEDHKSHEVSFLDSLQKKEKRHQYDNWENYQNPRVNMIKKSTKLYLLSATKAEISKYTDDNWSDCEVVNYSYSWEEPNSKSKDSSLINPEEKVNNVEDWDYEQHCKTFSQSPDKNDQLKLSTTSDNERVEYCEKENLENDCNKPIMNSKTANLFMNNELKVVDEALSKTKCEESLTGICKTTCLDQDDWNDQNEQVLEKSETNFLLEFKEQNLNALQNTNIKVEKEDWSDSEDYQSLQASFCEESESSYHMRAINDRIDEEYWTDFEDDYQSLQASFAEEYKSLDNTVEDETDCVDFFADILNNEEKLGHHDSFYVTKNPNSNESFSCKLNSLESSVGSQSDEAYLSNDEDVDDYDYMIVDENERSEPSPFAGQAVQEFLNLLDTLKHLPIQTQNIAVLHFISQQREQLHQSQ